ncbi:NUDIX hydrolase [Jeongeupia naejangsanensis]|uniref:NUDIX domain-containing protein n=1 Tax=Jeongeupia naejangsanensis TaxID=613195 RepID=A0ABS2BGN5_9NEIS|nr:NUDIX domain-containing protein [Jeongeupia naejangsanensis]MBM3114766.1 NUDIX domain-containing protein [Jeongeupia naejangsanensis]
MSAEPIRVVTLAVVRDGRLLTVRKRGTERFMLPGGKPDTGEADVATLAREVAEELRCAVATSTLLGEFSAMAANEPGRRVLARVYRGELDGEIELAAEIEALHWLVLGAPSPVPLAPLLAEHVLPVLTDDDLRGV